MRGCPSIFNPFGKVLGPWDPLTSQGVFPFCFIFKKGMSSRGEEEGMFLTKIAEFAPFYWSRRRCRGFRQPPFEGGGSF